MWCVYVGKSLRESNLCCYQVTGTISGDEGVLNFSTRWRPSYTYTAQPSGLPMHGQVNLGLFHDQLTYPVDVQDEGLLKRRAVQMRPMQKDKVCVCVCTLVCLYGR